MKRVDNTTENNQYSAQGTLSSFAAKTPKQSSLTYFQFETFRSLDLCETPCNGNSPSKSSGLYNSLLCSSIDKRFVRIRTAEDGSQNQFLKKHKGPVHKFRHA